MYNLHLVGSVCVGNETCNHKFMYCYIIAGSSDA